MLSGGSRNLRFDTLKIGKQIAHFTCLRLEASEKRFRSAFDGAEISIAISELADGTITAINPAYLKMLGCTAEELKSVAFSDDHAPRKPRGGQTGL
jgi:PAS domain-containing protein